MGLPYIYATKNLGTSPKLVWGIEKKNTNISWWSLDNFILGKAKVLLKLTSINTLALSDVLHVSLIKVNLISIALLRKVRVKVS